MHPLVFAALLVTSQDTADRWAPLVQKFQAEYPNDGPGAYVIAAEGDRIVFSKGFGQANLEHGIALTADSVVRIASLTKQFTSVAVLRLVRDVVTISLRSSQSSAPIMATFLDCPVAGTRRSAPRLAQARAR